MYSLKSVLVLFFLPALERCFFPSRRRGVEVELNVDTDERRDEDRNDIVVVLQFCYLFVTKTIASEIGQKEPFHQEFCGTWKIVLYGRTAAHLDRSVSHT